MSIKGQSKAEFKKNYTRVRDIITKSNGDKSMEISLARRQANLITDEAKCINRAMAAKEIGNNDIFNVFFRRAFELGAVPTSDYREYVLSKILE